MHYGDAFHCEHNLLVVGINIHSVMGSEDVEVHVTAVFNVKLGDPAELLRMLKNPRRYFMRHDAVRELKKDTTYLVTLVGDELGDYRITKLEEVTAESEEWKKLH